MSDLTKVPPQVRQRVDNAIGELWKALYDLSGYYLEGTDNLPDGDSKLFAAVGSHPVVLDAIRRGLSLKHRPY
jgi:hypothetical protein